MADWYWYEKTEDGAVRLLCVFGTSPEVVIPREIAAGTVVSLGAYCFAAGRRPDSYAVCSALTEGDGELERLLAAGKIAELSGRYVESVTLPETVVSIGDFCFYQCACLRELTVGKALTGIGGDAFMNCRSLRRLTVLGGAGEPSGLRKILGQRSRETEVVFAAGDGIEAALLYPEYSEAYDEIGPAHIFELSIEGEGFRARQCFQDGVVDFPRYDAVFVQACAAEDRETLCRMAWLRLYYPVSLRTEYRSAYENYLRENIRSAGELLVRERQLAILEFLAEAGFVTGDAAAWCIQSAVSCGWTEGAGMLLQKEQSRAEQRTEDAYSFEEF